MLIGVLENQLADRLYEKVYFYSPLCMVSILPHYRLNLHSYLLLVAVAFHFSFFLYDPLSSSNILFITSKILHELHMLETCHIF